MHGTQSVDSDISNLLLRIFYGHAKRNNLLNYVARPQSKFPTRPTASKPYIARSDCAYAIEQ
jgi:hypothetical protein